MVRIFHSILLFKGSSESSASSASIKSLSIRDDDQSTFDIEEVDPYIGKTLKTYLFERVLGTGAFGKVYLVRDQSNSQMYKLFFRKLLFFVS